MVSSPRPRWLQLNALNLVSKAQALADVPYMGPVFGVSKTSISGFVAVGPHCNCFIWILQCRFLEDVGVSFKTFDNSKTSDTSKQLVVVIKCRKIQILSQQTPRILFAI